jgi:regulator of telomere elongation helicase 1
MPIITSHGGLQVAFPYEPYPSQTRFIDSVTRAVSHSQHALLESPTGTGKTLCLLCALLAWQHSQPDDARPAIYYASRTHSQLAQVVRELKKTVYSPRMVVLGSREQAGCVNEQVRRIPSGSVQSAVCSKLCGKGQCQYRLKVNSVVTELGKMSLRERVMDLEELGGFAKRRGGCPFYTGKELAQSADLVLLPYNYLFEPETSKNFTLSGAVVVIDEAHNIDSFCCESASVEVSSDEFVMAGRELGELVAVWEGGLMVGETAIDPGKVRRLAGILEGAGRVFGGIEGEMEGEVGKLTGLLERVGIDKDSVESVLSDLRDVKAAVLENAVTKGRSSLDPVTDFLTTVYQTTYSTTPITGDPSNGFKMHIGPLSEQDQKGPKRVCRWCFNPGVAMSRLLSNPIRSLILTSGTLSPLSSFATELQIRFEVTLENEHVIDSGRQLIVGVCKEGPSGVTLSSSYANRHNDKAKYELGSLVVRVAEVVPDGVLVFFPSYTVMSEMLAKWRTPTRPSLPSLFDKLSSLKHVFVEPRERRALPDTIQSYYDALRDTSKRGAVFFAICRGKVAEGLDFADEKGRAVIVAGLPYPPLKDQRVILKRRYMDEQLKRHTQNHSLSGADWYSQQASRAVNQAIGRVIRHRQDYGAIILADERFGEKRVAELLSKWVRPCIVEYGAAASLVADLASFFKSRCSGNSIGGSSSSAVGTVEPVYGMPEYENCNGVDQNHHNTTSNYTCTVANVDLAAAMAALSQPPQPQHPPPKQKTPEFRESAQEFLSKWRTLLTPSQYKHFNHSLKQYRARLIDIVGLLKRLDDLVDPNLREEFYAGFRQFIPPKHLAAFEAHIHPGSGKVDEEGGCVVCGKLCEVADRPFRGVCGHLACFQCWASGLREQGACGKCGTKMRMTMLKKAF